MFPLSGRVAETLCKLAGIPPDPGGTRYGQWTWALYDHFECMNLIERWPGAQGRGSAFPIDVAMLRVGELSPRIAGRVVVMLGVRLNSAFGRCYLGENDMCSGFYSWRYASAPGDPPPSLGGGWLAPTQFVCIPHPSGLNRMLNDPAERERCGVVLREAMERARAKIA